MLTIHRVHRLPRRPEAAQSSSERPLPVCRGLADRFGPELPQGSTQAGASHAVCNLHSAFCQLWNASVADRRSAGVCAQGNWLL